MKPTIRFYLTMINETDEFDLLFNAEDTINRACDAILKVEWSKDFSRGEAPPPPSFIADPDCTGV